MTNGVEHCVVIGRWNGVFGEIFIQILCPFFNCDTCLYFSIARAVDTRLLLDARFANISPHSVDYIFTLLMVSFEALNFDQVQSINFFFGCLCLWCPIQETIA